MIYPWIDHTYNQECKGYVKFLSKLIHNRFELHDRNTIPGDILLSIDLALAYYIQSFPLFMYSKVIS